MGLTVGDGFRFGCGFFVAGFIYSVIVFALLLGVIFWAGGSFLDGVMGGIPVEPNGPTAPGIDWLTPPAVMPVPTAVPLPTLQFEPLPTPIPLPPLGGG